MAFTHADVPTGAAPDPTHVIIVGAGAAGLTVARLLRGHGIETTVLEARDRIGGRVDTRNIGGATVDVGGAWLDGVPRNPLYKLARSGGLTSVDMRYSVLRGLRLFDAESRSWLQWLTVLRAMISAERIYRNLTGDGPSQGARIDELAGSGRPLAREFARMFIRLEQAEEPDRVEASPGDGVEPYGGTQHMLVGGYAPLIDRIGAGTAVTFGSIVSQIDYGPDEVVVAASGGTYEGSHVVVTVPLGVLKSGSIRFSPPLPEAKTTAIDRVGFGNFEKVTMVFDEPFWRKPSRPRHDVMVRDEDGVHLFVDVSKTAGHPTLVATSGGDKARWVTSNPERTTKSYLDLLGRAFDQANPEPIATHVTTWASDPFARGSYSFPALGSTYADIDMLGEPVADRVLFAGEATAAAHHGYVGGAIETGVREAARLLGRPVTLDLSVE